MSLFDQFNWQGTTGFPYYWGWYWIGPINNAGFPGAPGMTDTATGQVWYLIIDPTGDHLQLTTQGPTVPHRILAASDYLYLGQFGVGLKVTNAHLVCTVFDNTQGEQGSPVFAPTSFTGIPTFVGGLFLSGLGGNPQIRPAKPHISVVVASIVSQSTPAEPAQIANPVVYNGYYYQLQDNNGAL
jgi:hypothetical protein